MGQVNALSIARISRLPLGTNRRQWTRYLLQRWEEHTGLDRRLEIFAPSRLSHGYLNYWLLCRRNCSVNIVHTFSLAWANHIKDTFDPRVAIKVVPDSGIFLDWQPTYGERKLGLKGYYFDHVMKLVNQNVSVLGKECVEANTDQQWKCFFAPYLLDHVKVPVFLI
jgi:hypothetical protein